MACTPNLEALRKYLTTAQIAELLSKHPSAVIRWILDGVLLSSGERRRLLAIRTPGGWRVAPESLEDFLAEITADRLGDSATSDQHDTIRAPLQRRRDHDRAAAELAAAGF